LTGFVTKQFAKQALRTIMVAYKDVTNEEWEAMRDEAAENEYDEFGKGDLLEQDLCVLGIFGIIDPLREGVQDAVATCHKAGVTVVMCTGDNIDTAVAISLNAGIVRQNELEKESGKFKAFMTGENFFNLLTEDIEPPEDGSSKNPYVTREAIEEMNKTADKPTDPDTK
jgi:magnesium-transporting ATPase (P-type)